MPAENLTSGSLSSHPSTIGELCQELEALRLNCSLSSSLNSTPMCASRLVEIISFY